ncbi:MAG: diacylglycerol kinase [Subtercola sp.]|nr:diacylglycerol kinase [Subtercola sp.]
MTDSSLKVAAVVYNPIKVDIAVLRANVEAEAQAAGWGETLWFETTVEDGGQGVTRQALEQNVDMVISAGGDGTVRAVAEALHDSNTPLALLPSGTGNLLARNLKLTLGDMPGSVHSAFTGIDRAIDLGLIDIERADTSRDRHAFVVMAGKRLVARLSRPEEIEIDGDSFGEAMAFNAWVVPGGLMIRVPAEHPATA